MLTIIAHMAMLRTIGPLAVFLFALGLLAGCKKESLLFQVNDQFAVYFSPDCECKVLKKHSENGSTVAAEHVSFVMGNRDQFLVQTIPPRSYSAVWLILQPDQTLRILPDNDAIETAIDMVKMDFSKDLRD